MSVVELGPETEALVILSASVAGWAGGHVDRAVLEVRTRDALAVAGRDAVEEAILQSYLFLGYPAALEALGVLREVESTTGRRSAPGSGPGATAAASAARSPDETGGSSGSAKREEARVDAAARRPPSPGEVGRWWYGGVERCREVYGSAFDAVRERVRSLHPEMERWTILEGYGKVLGRPGLDLVTRELCVVAILAVAGWPKQLYSHLRGARNVGGAEGRVKAALDTALEAVSVGSEVEREARAAWVRLRNR